VAALIAGKKKGVFGTFINYRSGSDLFQGIRNLLQIAAETRLSFAIPIPFQK